MLLGEISALSQKTGWCEAGRDHFAEWLHCDPTNVTHFVKKLEAAGYLEVARNPGYVSKMRVVTDAFYVHGGSERGSRGVVNGVHGGSERGSRGVVNGVHGGSERGSPEIKGKENLKIQDEIQNSAQCAPSFLSVQIFESRTETLEINKTESDNQFRRRGPKANSHTAEEIAANLKGPELEFYVDILNSGAWSDYLLHRKEIRVKPYRSAKSEAEAIRDFFKEAGGKSEIAQAIVNQSRAKGWTGLFKLKDRSNDNGNIRHNTNPGNGGDFFGGGDSPFFQGVK